MFAFGVKLLSELLLAHCQVDRHEHTSHIKAEKNGRCFADDIFECISLKENVWILIKISLKFVPKVAINNIPSLVQITHYLNLWWPSLLPHICFTQPQWLKWILNRVRILYANVFEKVICLNLDEELCYEATKDESFTFKSHNDVWHIDQVLEILFSYLYRCLKRRTLVKSRIRTQQCNTKIIYWSLTVICKVIWQPIPRSADTVPHVAHKMAATQVREPMWIGVRRRML